MDDIPEVPEVHTPPWAGWLLIIAGVVTAVGYLFHTGLKAFRCIDRVDDFLNDWFGDEKAGQPGVMARIERIEQRLDALERVTAPEPEGGDEDDDGTVAARGVRNR